MIYLKMCIYNKCNYRWKVYTEIALQREQQERSHFRFAVKLRQECSKKKTDMYGHLRGQRAEMRKEVCEVSEDNDYCTA